MYLGIDIASVDGNKLVDWTKAKAAGAQFVIFRGAYKLWADPTWKLEAARARAAGLVVGAYLFPVMDRDAPSAKAQCAAFAAAIGKLALGDLPPTLDVEFPGGVVKTKRSRRELVAWVREAVSELRTLFGIAPMIYTSARVWDGEDSDSLDVDGLKIDTPELLDCPLWLARYPFKTRIDAVVDQRVDTLPTPPVPKAWKDATNVWIHQYQGDALRFPGFSATADLNRFFDLRKGSKGQRVHWLQRKLRIVQDGIFGPATEKGVVDFQRANQLDATGIVDPRTFAYLAWVKVAG